MIPLDRPWKGHQALLVYDFLILILNFWKNFKVLSRFIQKCLQPPASLAHGLYGILSSYCLATLLFDKKIRLNAALFWFGLRWNSSNVLLTSRPPKNNCWLFHIFRARFGWKDCRFEPKQPVCRRNRRNRWIFVQNGSELWSLFKYSRLILKIKNL